MGDTPFISGTQPPAVLYDTQNVQPPAALAVSTNDQIVINLWGTTPVTVSVFIRLLLPDGTVVPNQWTATCDGTATTNTIAFPLDDGFLLSAVATIPTGAVQRGSVFCQLLIQRGSSTQGFTGQILISGYLTFSCAVSWPVGSYEYGKSGIGNLRRYAGTTPAAGSEISESVGTNVIWRLLSMSFRFTASAAAANRRITFQIGRSTLQWYKVTRGTVDTAGQVSSNVVSPAPYAGSVADGIFNLPIPPDMYLFGNQGITTSTVNLQAGDQYDLIAYEVEEWIEP